MEELLRLNKITINAFKESDNKWHNIRTLNHPSLTQGRVQQTLVAEHAWRQPPSRTF
jgi:hypothetical protein